MIKELQVFHSKSPDATAWLRWFSKFCKAFSVSILHSCLVIFVVTVMSRKRCVAVGFLCIVLFLCKKISVSDLVSNLCTALLSCAVCVFVYCSLLRSLCCLFICNLLLLDFNKFCHVLCSEVIEKWQVLNIFCANVEAERSDGLVHFWQSGAGMISMLSMFYSGWVLCQLTVCHSVQGSIRDQSFKMENLLAGSCNCMGQVLVFLDGLCRVSASAKISWPQCCISVDGDM